MKLQTALQAARIFIIHKVTGRKLFTGSTGRKDAPFLFLTKFL